jgi:DNA polymerase-3 subunit gamma/tau
MDRFQNRSLSRRYRPQTFADVVGQEAAVRALSNALQFSLVGPAYLFAGGRGVGKTTLARLLAKALNCESIRQGYEPCCQCASCMEIVQGQSLDFIEMDGASHRGIDDIRQIHETLGYAPARGPYKIILIDEVHMLTKEAFNALLKTLEEPPEHVKFLFATTEPHKVLPTILSRCQRFDLKALSGEALQRKLSLIAEALHISIEPKALDLISLYAEGSLRDAEMLVDQLTCLEPSTITEKGVRDLLGLMPVEEFALLDQAFKDGNLAFPFIFTERLISCGRDIHHVVGQMIEHYRQHLKNLIYQIGESSTVYSRDSLIFLLDLVLKGELAVQRSSFPRVALESLLLQIIRSRHRIATEELVATLVDLEQRWQQTPSSPNSGAWVGDSNHSTQSQPSKETGVSCNEVGLDQEDLHKGSQRQVDFHPSHYDTLIRFATVELEGIYTDMKMGK